MFGAAAYVHIPPEKLLRGEKFQPRAQQGFLVGYDDGLNYRIWLPQENEIIISAYVTFDETPRTEAISMGECQPLYEELSTIASGLDSSLDAVLVSFVTPGLPLSMGNPLPAPTLPTV